MKMTSLTACLLASSLLATSVFAQDQTAAAPAAPVEAAAPAADAPAAAAMPEMAPAPAAEATPAAAPEPALATQPAPSPAFSQAVFDAIGTPEPGKALVVFFRPSKFAGGAISFKVRENDVELGKMSSGTYFTAQVEPGAHTYVVHSEAKDVTNTEVEAGETYFLAGSISMGFMAGHPNLSPSDVAGFEALLPKLKKAKPLN